MKKHFNWTSIIFAGLTGFGIFVLVLFFNGRVGNTGQSEMNDGIFITGMAFVSLQGFYFLCYLPLYITTDADELVMHYLVTPNKHIKYNMVKALKYPIVISHSRGFDIYSMFILHNDKEIKIHHRQYLGLEDRIGYIKDRIELLQAI